MVLILLYVGYEAFFTTPPECSTTQTPTGAYCGGNCSLLCPDQTHDPVVLWARSFQTSPSTYTAAAYIQNNNVGAGAKQVAYSFQLFDTNNSLVVERDGVTDLPPVQTIPIIEPNINVGNATVVRTLFAFSSDNFVWSKIPASQIPTLEISQLTHNADYSSVSALLTNESLSDAQNITVAAVLFDTNGVALAASKSLIAHVPAGSSQTAVFTWSGGVPSAVSIEITVLPSF